MQPHNPDAATDEAARDVTLLDNRSAPCAVGLIRAARVMAELEPDSLLEIWSRDRFAPFEVPIWADNRGHTMVVKEQTGRWPRRYWRFLIRRGED